MATERNATRSEVKVRCMAPDGLDRDLTVDFVAKDVSRNMRWTWRLIRDETARLLLENSRLTQIRSRVGSPGGGGRDSTVRCHGHAS